MFDALIFNSKYRVSIESENRGEGKQIFILIIENQRKD
jgi:hypothetical protein